MHTSSNSRSPFRSAPVRGTWSSLLALLAVSIGWSLALANAAQLSSAQLCPIQLERDSACVRVDAELRVGKPAPTPVADVVPTQASLRALQLRARYAPPSFPQADSPSAAWLAAFALLPFRLRGRAQSTPANGAHGANGAGSAPHRAIARSWPLPRSSCSDSDPDADAARRS